jgi:outer membrane lipoprotein-sorting protein
MDKIATKNKHVIRRLLLLLLLLSAGLCLGWADSWESIRAAAENVNAISADFVQEKHLPILAKPLVSNGRFVYRRPDSLRWEYRSPVKSVLLMIDGKARRFVESEQGLVEDVSARMQATQFVMPEIGGWLSGRFEDNPMFDARLEEDGRIVLIPKDEGMARFIQRIELHLSERPGVIEQVLIFEGEEAYTRMQFTDIQVNPVIEDRLFREVE